MMMMLIKFEKRADSREPAAPWQGPPPGVPFDNGYQLCIANCLAIVRRPYPDGNAA